MKEHIIINKDRTVVVPDSVRKIGIQYDHKVNTLTFDCPRYADDNQSIDMSRMAIYINFSRNDKTKGSVAATNVFVDPDDPEIMHFDFIITRSVTLVNGSIICLVCAKSTDAEGVEVNHWNSELFNKLSVGEGMEAEEELTEEEIDYIASLLQEINTTHAEVADIDTRVEDLEFNQEKQGAVSEVDLKAMTWTDGSYITGSGTIGSSSGYGISELVTLPKMSTLILDATGYQSDVAMIAKSDHTPLVTSVDGKTHYEYYTDEEIQVYISCKTTVAKSAKIVRNVAETLSDLERENSELKGDLDDVRTEKETNLLKFIEANWTTSDVIVNSNANSSVMHIKANNLTLASQQVFNVMLNNLIILEPNTTYTLSTSIINRVSSQIRANNISLNRRDNYASVALIQSFLENVTPNKQYITFTTPTDETRFYFTFTFANGAWDCDIDLNINISKGSEPNYSQYGIVVDLNNTLPTIEKIFKHNIYDIIVSKDGTGDYTSLTEAVANANDFDTIFIKNGTYENEIVKAWLKTVFIIGESRDGVIIKNNTGEYANPPIEMGTGMLKNLTVYAEGNATPTNKGYALHSESSVEASSCNFFILENCTFKSDYRQSWGMGMRGDTHYYARNCTFEEVYFHDCEHAYRATNQYIEFDSCNVIAKANGTALLLQDQQMSGANVNLMFNRCLVKSENGANIQYGKWTGSGVEWVSSLDDFPTWHLSTYSFGNSDNALNA